MDNEQPPAPQGEAASIPLTFTQAAQLAYWEREVSTLESLLARASTARLAYLSAVVAGVREGEWNVDEIRLIGPSPSLEISRGA